MLARPASSGSSTCAACFCFYSCGCTREPTAQVASSAPVPGKPLQASPGRVQAQAARRWYRGQTPFSCQGCPESAATRVLNLCGETQSLVRTRGPAEPHRQQQLGVCTPRPLLVPAWSSCPQCGCWHLSERGQDLGRRPAWCCIGRRERRPPRHLPPSCRTLGRGQVGPVASAWSPAFVPLLPASSPSPEPPSCSPRKPHVGTTASGPAPRSLLVVHFLTS